MTHMRHKEAWSDKPVRRVNPESGALRFSLPKADMRQMRVDPRRPPSTLAVINAALGKLYEAPEDDLSIDDYNYMQMEGR